MTAHQTDGAAGADKLQCFGSVIANSSAISIDFAPTYHPCSGTDGTACSGGALLTTHVAPPSALVSNIQLQQRQCICLATALSVGFTEKQTGTKLQALALRLLQWCFDSCSCGVVGDATTVTPQPDDGVFVAAVPGTPTVLWWRLDLHRGGADNLNYL